MLVFNASPLILLFEEIDEPQIVTLCKKLDSNLVVPMAVYQELQSPKCRVQMNRLINEKTLVVCNNGSPDISQDMINRFPHLHEGEINVMAIVCQNPESCTAIIDEGEARGVAQKLNLPMKGIFGLLLELYKLKEIDLNQLKTICKKIDKSSFRINFSKLGYEWVLT